MSSSIEDVVNLVTSKKQGDECVLEAVVNVYCETEELVPNHASHVLLDSTSLPIFGTFGQHPHHASKWTAEVEQGLRQVLKHPKCVALGECGLDFHYMTSPKEVFSCCL